MVKKTKIKTKKIYVLKKRPKNIMTNNQKHEKKIIFKENNKKNKK